MPDEGKMLQSISLVTTKSEIARQQLALKQHKYMHDLLIVIGEANYENAIVCNS